MYKRAINTLGGFAGKWCNYQIIFMYSFWCPERERPKWNCSWIAPFPCIAESMLEGHLWKPFYDIVNHVSFLCLSSDYMVWRSDFIWYSNAVAPLEVLWPKKIMCCSWRWVVVAPNPKDFGLFLAQVVWMIQPKMEMSSRWQEFEVSQVQHLLCLQDEGK